MSIRVVTPPAAAARVAVANPSHSVRPGSFTCTCVSTRPGSSTSSRPFFSSSACDRLLMSSEVQAKWMNSEARITSGLADRRSFSQYSTALTS